MKSYMREKLKERMLIIIGWGDDLVGKPFTEKVEGPEFESQELM